MIIMADFVSMLMSFSPFILVIVVIGIIAYAFIKITKSYTKPISRAEIERKHFIERMIANKNQFSFKWLYRGKDSIGKITHARTFVIEGNPSKHKILEMVIKPTLLWKIPNPLTKQKAFQINYEEIEGCVRKTNIMTDGEKLIVPEWISFNQYFGIYYDITIAREHQDIILKKDLSLTDLENEKSVDFAKSQEMATIGYVPFAHDMGMKEKDIQHEIARKKGEQQSI
jgi:hypothetical protein